MLPSIVLPIFFPRRNFFAENVVIFIYKIKLLFTFTECIISKNTVLSIVKHLAVIHNWHAEQDSVNFIGIHYIVFLQNCADFSFHFVYYSQSGQLSRDQLQPNLVFYLI